MTTTPTIPPTQDPQAPGAGDVYVFPASFAQQRLWLHDRTYPGVAVYNVPVQFRIDGPLRVDVLRRALDTLVARHEVLRTTFAEREGEILQVVSPTGTGELAERDLRDLPEAAREARARELSWAEAGAPFDLATGPLLRVLVLRTGEAAWRLVVNAHHIVIDGVSLGILLEELSASYAAEASGGAASLPALDVQYADFALWQRDWLAGEALETQLAFWRERLAGELPLLALPLDRPRPSRPSFRGALHTATIPADVMQQMSALARREGVSLFVLLMAAFKVLLARHTGQTDILVGSPVANRYRPELERAVGFYANTLVYRTDLTGAPAFTTVLQRVRDTAMGVFAHQDAPFERVVEAIRPVRDPSYHPVFQAMFSYQRSPGSALQLAGARVAGEPIGSGTSRFDLWMDLQDSDAGALAYLEYSTDLFDAATMERLLEHYFTLLRGIATTPGAPVTLLPVMDDAERRRVLVEWNDTAAGIPAGTVDALVAAQARERGASPAVECDGTTLTYEELEARANGVAQRLRALGVGTGALVGVFVERTAAMVPALLGIWKAGGAYLPLDPDYPADRVAFMLRDSGAKVVVTQASLAASLPAHEAAVLALDDVAPATEAPATEPRSARDLAYVIYTSGSTGTPKGVRIQHRALANFLASVREVPGFGADDRLLAVTTLSFDIAGLELYLPLVTGGTVVLVPQGKAADGYALRELLESSRITVMQATPSTWHLLLAAGWGGDARLKVLVGGEAVPPELVEALAPRVGELWNMYGPTETTIWSTRHRLAAGAPVLIGRPLANTQVYVLDDALQPTATGVVGELYIGGSGLAEGYHRRPELTAERFVANPFAGAAADVDARMYRTGDLGRWLPDGTLAILGRVDNQVKVRGYRIELGEVESALATHPSVKQAVVAVCADNTGDQRLVAYVVSHAGASALAAELRRHVRQALPAYMVPSQVVEMDALPLTANGKIDRRRLPDPFRVEDRYVAPRTEAERALAQAWSEVLGIERVGVHDNFFDLGGHSLLAMRVLSRLDQRFRARLNPGVLVAQTLEQIAADAERQAASPGAGGAIGRAQRGAARPAEQTAITDAATTTPAAPASGMPPAAPRPADAGDAAPELPGLAGRLFGWLRRAGG